MTNNFSDLRLSKLDYRLAGPRRILTKLDLRRDVKRSGYLLPSAYCFLPTGFYPLPFALRSLRFHSAIGNSKRVGSHPHPVGL